MTIPEILAELKPYTGKFPMAAMKGAIEQREGITPELLRELEEMAADGQKGEERKDGMLQTFAIYLLAQFREKRAFQPLVKLVSLPGEAPFDLFGDTITGGLCRLLGTVYDGDQKALERLVESEEVNEYVRSAALDSFIVLERSGQMAREQVVAYFRELFQGRLKREHSHAWDGLVCCCADLPAQELLPEVRKAYEDGLVDTQFANLRGIERDMLKDPEENKRGQRDNYRLITDAIEELKWWDCFDPEPELRRAENRKPGSSQTEAPRTPSFDLKRKSSGNPSTAYRREAKVGRNDLCPCGSGKKYKKCCLGKAES